jgi:hypothetical protein
MLLECFLVAESEELQPHHAPLRIDSAHGLLRTR